MKNSGQYQMVEVNESPVRFELETKFKDFFDEYTEDDEQLIIGDLLTSVADKTINTTLSYHQLMQALHSANRKLPERIGYTEFSNIVVKNSSSFESKIELASYQKVIEVAVGTVLPNNMIKDRHTVQWFVWQYRCTPRQFPWFIFLISLAQVATFAGLAYQSSHLGREVSALRGYPINCSLSWMPDRRYEAWRFVSYCLIHEGWLPLLVTLLIQIPLGVQLEIVYRWWRILFLYLLGVIAGSLLHSIYQVESLKPSRLAGGSGGLYALVGAHLLASIADWAHMRYNWRNQCTNRLCSVPLRAIYLVLATILDVSLAIVQMTRPVTTFERNSISAHFGGLLTGFIFGWPLFKGLDQKPWQQNSFFICFTVYSVFCLFSVLWNIFYKDFPSSDRMPCCSY